MKTFFRPVIAVAFVLVSVFSCQQKDEKQQDVPDKASVVFETDSLLFDSLEADSSLAPLTASEVRELTGDFFDKDTLNDFKWIFGEFYRIDSLKKAGKYNEYVEHLDLGMTKDIAARKLKEVKLEDGSVFRIWTVKHGSYEACPFTSGSEIFATLVYEGKIKDCFLIGQELHSSDPPVWLTVDTYGSIYSNGLVKVDSKESNCEGEVDKNNVDIVLNKFEEISFVIRQGKTTNLVTKAWDN